jgi:predicted chitinase
MVDPNDCNQDSDRSNHPCSEGPGDPCDSDNPPAYCGNNDKPKPCKVSGKKIQNAYTYHSPSKEISDELSDMIKKHGDDFGITNKARMQHFLGQVGEESSGLTQLSEDLKDYSAHDLLAKFPQYFFKTNDSKVNPDDYVGKPEKIANLVYGNNKDLGNRGAASGDGWKYRARGIMGLTGRSNYKAFTNYYDKHFNSTKDFNQNPGLIASNNKLTVLSGMWFYKYRVLSKVVIDDNTSVYQITEAVNGGKNGLDNRKEYYKEVKQNIPNCNNK